jgi:hypothetical protein
MQGWISGIDCTLASEAGYGCGAVCDHGADEIVGDMWMALALEVDDDSPEEGTSRCYVDSASRTTVDDR